MTSDSFSLSGVPEQLETPCDSHDELSQNISDVLADLSLPAESSDLSLPPESPVPRPSHAPSASLSSPMDLSGDDDSDVQSFLMAFNSRYDLSAARLFDVLDLVDALLSKKPRAASANPVDAARVQELRTANSKLQLEKESLSAELAAAKSQVATLQQSIGNFRSEHAGASENLKALQAENENLRHALESMNSLMELQIGDIASLGQQRTELLSLTKRQDEAMAELEKHCRSAAAPVREIRKRSEAVVPKSADPTDEFYTVMCSAIVFAEESIPDFLANLIAIRDDSQTPLRERILLMFRALVNQSSRLQSEVRQLTVKNDESNCSLQKYHLKCTELLSLFEEELHFLRTLSQSGDLQAAIFSAKGNAHVFTEEEKVELIRHCAMMGRFVEDTLGVISPDRFSPPVDIRATHVFELLQSTNLEDKLSNLVARFGSDDETVEFRELFDLLAAQVFINDLLKGHTSDLHTRIAHYGHEIAALRQQTDDRGAQDEQIEDLKQLVKHLKRKESKLRRFLSRNLEIRDDAEPIEIVRDLIEQANGQSNLQSSAALEQKDDEIRALQANVHKAHKVTEEFRIARQHEIDRQTSELQTQLKEIRARFDEVARQNEAQANEVISLRAAVKEKDNLLKSEIEAVEKRHQSEMSEANDKLSASAAQIETMTNQIKEFEAAVASVKKQRQRLGHQIDRLQTTNRELQESIETQTSQVRDQYESKIREVVDESEKIIRERDSLMSQNQVLDAKNQQLVSEVATVNIAKKSLDLKLRAYDERSNLEKRNIQSQVAAQVAAAQVEQANLVAQLQTEIDQAVHDLLGLLTDEIESRDLQTVTAAVEKEFESARRSQYLYLDLLEDVTEAQKVLGLNSASKITRDVRDLVERKAALERKLADVEKKAKQDRQEADQARREVKKSEEQVLALRLWESWGQRVHRVVHEVEAAQLKGKDLRLVLEESLLSSVAHRSVSTRLDSLRCQKQLFVKFDRKMLMAKQPLRGGLRPLVVILFFVRRMQKFSGHLPMAISLHSESDSFTRLSRETPRRRRSKSARKHSPLRPKIPLAF